MSLIRIVSVGERDGSVLRGLAEVSLTPPSWLLVLLVTYMSESLRVGKEAYILLLGSRYLGEVSTFPGVLWVVDESVMILRTDVPS